MQALGAISRLARCRHWGGHFKACQAGCVTIYSSSSANTQGPQTLANKAGAPPCPLATAGTTPTFRCASSTASPWRTRFTRPQTCCSCPRCLSRAASRRLVVQVVHSCRLIVQWASKGAAAADWHSSCSLRCVGEGHLVQRGEAGLAHRTYAAAHLLLVPSQVYLSGRRHFMCLQACPARTTVVCRSYVHSLAPCMTHSATPAPCSPADDCAAVRHRAGCALHRRAGRHGQRCGQLPGERHTFVTHSCCCSAAARMLERSGTHGGSCATLRLERGSPSASFDLSRPSPQAGKGGTR